MIRIERLNQMSIMAVEQAENRALCCEELDQMMDQICEASKDLETEVLVFFEMEWMKMVCGERWKNTDLYILTGSYEVYYCEAKETFYTNPKSIERYCDKLDSSKLTAHTLKRLIDKIIDEL